MLLERVLLGEASCCPFRCELRLHGLLPSFGVGGMSGDVEQIEVVAVYDIFHLEYMEGKVLSKSDVVYSKCFCEVDVRRSDVAIRDVAKSLPRGHTSPTWSLNWLVFGKTWRSNVLPSNTIRKRGLVLVERISSNAGGEVVIPLDPLCCTLGVRAIRKNVWVKRHISGVNDVTSQPVLDQISIVDVVEAQVDSGSAARVVLATFFLVDVHKNQAK